MVEESRREALATFLKARRKALQPEEVGLARSKRRRTPGLRREEVAELASISTAWYIKLEQAQDVVVSDDVLFNIASALALNADETRYIMRLARNVPLTGKASRVSPALSHMLRSLVATPAYVTGAYANLLAWNPASQLIFGDFAQIPAADRNIMLLTFTNPLIRERIINWEAYARDLTGHFLANAALHLGAPRFDEVVATLQATSEPFAAWWQAADVQTEPEIPIEVHHPEHGRLDFTLLTFQLVGGSPLRVCQFIPNEHTRHKLAP